MAFYLRNYQLGKHAQVLQSYKFNLKEHENAVFCQYLKGGFSPFCYPLSTPLIWRTSASFKIYLQGTSMNFQTAPANMFM